PDLVHVAQGLHHRQRDGVKDTIERRARIECGAENVQHDARRPERKGITSIKQGIEKSASENIIEERMRQDQVRGLGPSVPRVVPALYKGETALAEAAATVENDKGVGGLHFYAGRIAAEARLQGKRQSSYFPAYGIEDVGAGLQVA